jgi:hypothetical protein
MAAPLFTAAERTQNARLERLLIQEGKTSEMSVKTTLPQRKGLQRFNSKTQTFDVNGIVYDCMMDSANHEILLCCLDGPDADSGSSAEYGIALGQAIAAEKAEDSTGITAPKIITYRTDFRTDPDKEVGVNAMLKAVGTSHVYHPCFKIEESEFEGYYTELAQKLIKEISNATPT